MNKAILEEVLIPAEILEKWQNVVDILAEY
jgi:hypothetical protein